MLSPCFRRHLRRPPDVPAVSETRRVSYQRLPNTDRADASGRRTSNRPRWRKPQEGLVMLLGPVYVGVGSSRVISRHTMEPSLMRFHAKYVSAAEAGDYYQVSFETEDPGDRTEHVASGGPALSSAPRSMRISSRHRFQPHANKNEQSAAAAGYRRAQDTPKTCLDKPCYQRVAYSFECR